MAAMMGVVAQAVSTRSPRPALAVTAPNIVLVMADDMDARMLDDLPGLQALLVEKGLSFTSAYTGAPVCCPARAAFLRGQYPHNNGVLANGPPQGGFTGFRNRGNEASTVATWLQDAGYRTALIGKYLNEYEKALKHIPAGWNRWFAYGGKGKYTTYLVSDEGKVRQYGKDKKNKHYQTDILPRKAVEFIRSTPENKPLFLYLTPSAPHAPAKPADRHRKAAIPADQAPRVPSFNEDDLSDKLGIWSKRGPLKGKSIRNIDSNYLKQVKSMLAVENMIEDVIAALEDAGRLNNTYIVFTSDNGLHHGEHRIGLDKNTPFEESTRAPLVVVGPGVPAGASSDAMVSLIDLGPTFADLAGTTAPDFVDGRSLTPLLDGSTPPGWRDAVISELLRGPKKGFVVLRSGPYVYTAYGDGDRELYDLSVDPYQLENIAASAPQSLLDDLEARLDALAACGGTGTACQSVDGGA
jgi:N-acetylglucosamine-6-sulfatase